MKNTMRNIKGYLLFSAHLGHERRYLMSEEFGPYMRFAAFHTRECAIKFDTFQEAQAAIERAGADELFIEPLFDEVEIQYIGDEDDNDQSKH